MTEIVVVTSGKGGVGKTTSSAAIATGLANKGHKTVVIDFDVGLRNLDLIMGCERRVVYDLVNVLNGEATLNQALIKDKRVDGLFILPASQTRDKDALTKEGVGEILDELSKTFEYIICDSPAGIEKGALMALYYADTAIVVTNPEVSSVRDSDRILGILQSKSRRAELGQPPVHSSSSASSVGLFCHCTAPIISAKVAMVETSNKVLSGSSIASFSFILDDILVTSNE